ncbi:MAG: hypothetical protein N3A58_02650 [Spirochaetes bacterium]|nr:hypothetical protein [Spirochaetota bacterium]
MKKIIVLLFFLFCFFTSIYAYPSYFFDDIFGIGLVIHSQVTSSESSTGLFDRSLWGITFRYKSPSFLGVLIDLLYFKKMYWTTYGASPYFYPYPYSEAEFKSAFPSINLSDWDYYHEEFFLHLDLALYFPLYPFMCHFAIGPSFWLAGANEDVYESNAYFKIAFDEWYKGGFTVGFNTKLGFSLFLEPISIGLEWNYMTKSVSEFFERVFKDDPDYTDKKYYGIEYLKRMGYIEFFLILWFS